MLRDVYPVLVSMSVAIHTQDTYKDMYVFLKTLCYLKCLSQIAFIVSSPQEREALAAMHVHLRLLYTVASAKYKYDNV